MARKNRPHTPDGRYLVSKGIFKRCTNPSLDDGISVVPGLDLVGVPFHPTDNK